MTKRYSVFLNDNLPALYVSLDSNHFTFEEAKRYIIQHLEHSIHYWENLTQDEWEKFN